MSKLSMNAAGSPLHRTKGNWTKAAAAIGLSLAFALTACDNKPSTAPETPQPSPEVAEDPAMTSATLGAWLLGIDVLTATLGETENLAEAVQDLLDEPSEAKLEGLRLAWHRSHEAYIEFELFTALSGSNPGLFGSLVEYDFALEAWPIQPGYLDYYDVYTHSGIVNDIAMPLTADALRQQHGFTDSSDVSLGFHSLEYLLWGESGARPASDYVEADISSEQQNAGVRPVDLPSNRRRVLLTLVADLLVDDIAAFKQAFQDSDGTLRRNYLALQPYSRLALLQNAGYALLSHHRDLLQAQLEQHAEDNETSAVELRELQHNPFAGRTPSTLAHSLQTVERVLFEAGSGVAGSANGLGQWLLTDEEQRDAKLQQLTQLRTALLSWHDQSWPPSQDKGQAMVESLTDLIEVLEPEPVAGL